MLCGWEDNCRSGVTLVMCQREYHNRNIRHVDTAQRKTASKVGTRNWTKDKRPATECMENIILGGPIVDRSKASGH